MKKLFFKLLTFGLIFYFYILNNESYSQGVVRYEKTSYVGPIEKGYLYSDEYYLKQYKILKLQIKLIESYKAQSILDSNLILEQDSLVSILNKKISLRDSTISSNNKTIGDLNNEYEKLSKYSSTKIERKAHRKAIFKTVLYTSVITFIGTAIILKNY